MIPLTIKELNVLNSIVSDHYFRFDPEFINEKLPLIVHKICIGEDVKIPSNIETIGGRAFSYTRTKSVIFNEGLKRIGTSAFDGCNINSTLRSISGQSTMVGQTGTTEINYAMLQNGESSKKADLLSELKNSDYITDGMTVMNGPEAEVRVGNCLPLENIPVGTQIHNIELLPGKGGQLVRSAGLSAQLMAKEGKYATLRLPSGEMRMVPIQCRATIGVIGNGDHNLVNIGKAGRKRHMGVRPTVRGSVMNPNDHPHGGGEGKAPVGRPGPCTPWGKPALGLKTRKKNKQSNKLIVRRRDGKAIK